MCSRKVNSHDLEDSCFSTTVKNEATCFRSLSNTTFQQIQSCACPSLRAAQLLSWGRDPAPGPACCTERRAPTGESHLGVLFDDAACVGTPAHLFFKDAWSVMLSESDLRWGWPAGSAVPDMLFSSLCLLEWRPSISKERHTEKHRGRCRDWYNDVPRRIFW